jgi:hypothetical protein
MQTKRGERSPSLCSCNCYLTIEEKRRKKEEFVG